MDNEKILLMCKARLDRSHTNLIDNQLLDRIDAGRAELEGKGIHLREDDPNDTMLLVDLVCWRYGARDKQVGMPEWLRLAIRERWLWEARNAT